MIENTKAVFTMSTWGNEVSITRTHSDLDAIEVLEIFKGLFIASGWSEEVWKDNVCYMAMEYEEQNKEKE